MLEYKKEELLRAIRKFLVTTELQPKTEIDLAWEKVGREMGENIWGEVQKTLPPEKKEK